MGKLSELKASFDQVVEEHRELQRMIQELRGHLERPQPQLTGGTSHVWASVLAQQLVRLHDKLFLHFRKEEQAGILDELAKEFPRASRAVERLRDEHGEVLVEVREILGAAMSCAAEKPPPGPSVSGRTMSLLDRLDRHERKETDLIERLYCEELGGEHS
jgi:hypothetical protein